MLIEYFSAARGTAAPETPVPTQTVESTELQSSVPVAASTEPVSNGVVAFVGLAIVFIGLVMVILCIKVLTLVTALTRSAEKTAEAPVQSSYVPIAPVSAGLSLPSGMSREELSAVIGAAICTCCDSDPSYLRIVSIKRLDA